MKRYTGLDPVDGSVVGSQPVLVGAGAVVGGAVVGGAVVGGAVVGGAVVGGAVVGGSGSTASVVKVVSAGCPVLVLVVVEAARPGSRVVLVVLVVVVVVVGRVVVVGSHTVVGGGLAVVVPAKARFRPGGGTVGVVGGCAGWRRSGAVRTKLRGPASAHDMLSRRSLARLPSLDAPASLAHLARRFPLAWSHWSRALPAARA
jgi:hypothetical protein